jgi:hypothetical protein
MPGKLTCRPLSAVIIFLVWSAAGLRAQQATTATEQAAKTTASPDRTASEAAPYKKIRQDEDWSYLRNDPGRKIDYLDKLKYIPLRDEDGWYVSLGGDVRERYEFLDHPLWGQGATDTNGYLMQRFMLHADIHLGSRVRFFSQFQSGLVSGRNGGPRPTDEDKFEFHQAFVDLNVRGKNLPLLSFRVGRQELSFGTSRLVSIREEPNVRQSFDGLRAILYLRQWRIDGFVTKPVATNPGVFDDSPDHTRTFWGLYAVRPWKVLPGGHVDLYYMGIDRKNARFDQGAHRETRHSVGTRLWGGREEWDYNYELVYQWGSFGSANIRAWTLASDNGFTLSRVHFRPRMGLKADVTSGDRDKTDPSLQTFNAFFPKGAYFGEIALIGPANHMDLQPSVDLRLTKRWTLTSEAGFFWRQSIHDGIYGPAINLLRAAGSSGSRFIGSQFSTEAKWEISRHFSWAGNYTYFFAGQFLRDTKPAKDVNFFTTWIYFLF